MMPYERFRAWRACHELTIATYRMTQQFPKHELYGLTSQMRRAAFSAAVNIAEGSIGGSCQRINGRNSRSMSTMRAN